jgi:hypothetical protein
MPNFFKREAKFMLLWPLVILVVGLVAAILVPHFLRR